MKTLVAAAFLASLFAGAATAMPLGPVTQGPHSDIIQVAGECGPEHRGTYGGCRNNWAKPCGTRLPARLSHRPRRTLPRQLPVLLPSRPLNA